MKNIIENIKTNSSVFCKGALMFVFLLLLASTVINSFFKTTWRKNLEFMPPPFDEAREVRIGEHFNNIPNRYEKRVRYLGSSTISRNFFQPVRAQKTQQPFLLNEIVFEECFHKNLLRF